MLAEKNGFSPDNFNISTQEAIRTWFWMHFNSEGRGAIQSMNRMTEMQHNDSTIPAILLFESTRLFPEYSSKHLLSGVERIFRTLHQTRAIHAETTLIDQDPNRWISSENIFVPEGITVQNGIIQSIDCNALTYFFEMSRKDNRLLKVTPSVQTDSQTSSHVGTIINMKYDVRYYPQVQKFDKMLLEGNTTHNVFIAF